MLYGNWETWISQLLQVHSRIYTITATGLHSILFGKTTKVYWRDRNWKTHRSCTEREISQMRITSYKNSILLNLSIIHVTSSNVVSFSIHIAVSGYNFNSYLFSVQLKNSRQTLHNFMCPKRIWNTFGKGNQDPFK